MIRSSTTGAASPLFTAIFTCAALGVPAATFAEAARIELISVSTLTGGPALGRVTDALRPISANGRYVAFEGWLDNIVPGDTNGFVDVFVRDRLTQTTECVTVAYAGGHSTGGGSPSISADGRFVAFSAAAPDLVPGDTNDSGDVFVRDRQTGVTERVSVSSSGEQAEHDSTSYQPMISGNGRFVLFLSYAGNLVPGDTNDDLDVFVHDRYLATTQRINVGPAGEQSDHWTLAYYATISDDGRYVAFRSKATNIVPDDPDPVGEDLYLRDLVTQRTVRLINGYQQDPVISGNGRFVAYYSDQVYVLDRVAGTTEAVSVNASHVAANGISYEPSVSPDGRYVAFLSTATNLVPGLEPSSPRTHAYIRDRLLGRTELVTVNSRGVPLHGNSAYPWVSADGQSVAFQTKATNIVPNDTNQEDDVYVRQRGADQPAYDFTVRPAALDFGALAIGTSKTLSFWVRNKGLTPLPIRSVSLRGTDFAQFRLNRKCGAQVAPGAGCSIQVAFTPTSLGPASVKVRIDAGAAQLRVRSAGGTGATPTP